MSIIKMQTILSVKKMSFEYGKTEVLSDVSFTVDKGDYVVIAGPNGAGKTTLVKLILGLEKNKLADIEIFGKDIRHFSDWDKIGYLPQRVGTFNTLFPAKVGEVVGLGLLSRKKYPRVFNKEDRKKISETLDLLGAGGLKDRHISELSGGQQQKIFLARAIVSDPDLLIMDEPSTALDSNTRDDFFDIIEKLNKKGVTILIITHDVSYIKKYVNKILHLDKKIIFYGSINEYSKLDCLGKDTDHHSAHHHLSCNKEV